MRIPFSGPNWVDLPLNLSLCCRQHLLWKYSNQSRHPQRAGTHLRSEQNSYTNPLMHIFIGLHIHAHTHTHTEHSSEEFDFSRLSAFADRDTSTSQGSPSPPRPPWQASPWHPSDHCGATVAAPYISISPLFFPHNSSTEVWKYVSEQSRALPTYTYTPPQCSLTNFEKKRTSPLCIRAVFKWDTVRIGVCVTSMWVSYITSYWVTPAQHFLLTGKPQCLYCFSLQWRAVCIAIKIEIVHFL